MSLPYLLLAAFIAVLVVFAAQKLAEPPFRSILQWVAVGVVVIVALLWLLGEVPREAMGSPLILPPPPLT